MKICFLGTGSGWGVMIRQDRGTGGIWLEIEGKDSSETQKIIMDPGPGFLLRSKQYKINPAELTAVFVSHAHTDHSAEANVALEAMSLGHKGKYGVLLAGHNALESSEEYTQVISEFHKKLPERILEMAPGSRADIGSIKVFGAKTNHYEPKCVGFVIEGDKKVGYTADGEYFPWMGSQFEGCDVLIVNNFLPHGEFMPGHMNTEGAIMLAMEAKPKRIVITHFSESMIEKGPHHEASLIEKQTGIMTTAAEDGMKLKI